MGGVPFPVGLNTNSLAQQQALPGSSRVRSEESKSMIMVFLCSPRKGIVALMKLFRLDQAGSEAEGVQNQGEHSYRGLEGTMIPLIGVDVVMP